ncbi:MAG: hypothetical protein M1838_001557 [Thelocarpon superellum]|nr:MAG: hypothetical protein M1838_001557 [Thelocarpon superellum]
MAVQKCVHKGCGKSFTDADEECNYHPGPPVFHEGQKGWKCCKPRVLSFDEFLAITPCTQGKHSTVDDTPAAEPATRALETVDTPSQNAGTSAEIPQTLPQSRAAQAQPESVATPPPAPESDSDDPSLSISAGMTCRRRGCDVAYKGGSSRESEECIYHPGHALFHEGSKGWTCCKKRVLEFDEFMRIKGCATKQRHMFVGSGKSKKGTSAGEEMLDSVRHDFYQTSTTVIASLFLKKIDASRASITFPAPKTVALDLPTTDNKRYRADVPLYGAVDSQASTYKIMGTKLELELVKATDAAAPGEAGAGLAWPVLRSDERTTGEILQVGRAGRA